MRTNLPVSNHEYVVPTDSLLVSTTDQTGVITHANQAFVDASGFDYIELIGQPHNLVRHPDMPPEAFKDMWATVGRGRPWSGIVKNRRKNGDYYWVQANVTPILEQGKPKGYMSVRFGATHEQIKQAEAVYAQLKSERESGRRTMKLHAGRVRQLGWRDLPGRIHRLSLSQRVGIATFALVALGMLPRYVGGPLDSVVAQAGMLLAGATAMVLWFHHRFSTAIREADAFAGDLASCNLTTSIALNHYSPLGSLIRRLWQVQINLRAIVSDVRDEVTGTTSAISEIARGSVDLSKRTEEQASSLQQTASSMEQLASTVKQTADTAHQASQFSASSTAAARLGGEAMRSVGETIGEIERSSQTVTEIITVIEGIAFQTNILALNAAVEAARAGEHGRGFAVVASEVRSLAVRSADAAKQIRELINSSAEQVSHGTHRMVAAADTIQKTLTAVSRISEMVTRISDATHEQSSGIDQVNQAVALLDGVTQKNAAMLEETAAATEALRQRTSTLQRSVQVFSLH